MTVGSAHFNEHELACPHCHVALARPKLLALLERIRAEHGVPMPLRSAYRCPVHNAAVGGAKDSQHMYGAAADIPPGRVSPARAIELGATGVGIAGRDVVHVDVRDGSVTTWHY